MKYWVFLLLFSFNLAAGADDVFNNYTHNYPIKLEYYKNQYSSLLESYKQSSGVIFLSKDKIKIIEGNSKLLVTAKAIFQIEEQEATELPSTGANLLAYFDFKSFQKVDENTYSKKIDNLSIFIRLKKNKILKIEWIDDLENKTTFEIKNTIFKTKEKIDWSIPKKINKI